MESQRGCNPILHINIGMVLIGHVDPEIWGFT